VSVGILRRELAPIVDEAWEEIDREAKRVLALGLTGRKIVDFDGPHGWSFAARNTGRLAPPGPSPVEGVEARRRLVQPLVELRAPFRLHLDDLEGAARGARMFDLDAIVEAAERIARAEDGAIFHGYADAGIIGIAEASPHAALPIPPEPSKFPGVLLEAVEVLREAGVNGPYVLAAGNDCYRRIALTTELGHPIRRWVEQQILDGPVLRAPSVEGALLVSRRGGDFELTVGQDFSIGYAGHDTTGVDLYLTESFTFEVVDGSAAVTLLAADQRIGA
jgi:uncharacterized linocin/CFP29 family protein